jgi:hypothetical protein
VGIVRAAANPDGGGEKSVVLVMESVNCIVDFSAKQGNSIIR